MFTPAKDIAETARLLEQLPIPERTHVQIEVDSYDTATRTQVTIYMYDGFATDEVGLLLDDVNVVPEMINRGHNAWVEGSLSNGAEFAVFVRDEDAEHYSRTHNIRIDED